MILVCGEKLYAKRLANKWNEKKIVEREKKYEQKKNMKSKKTNERKRKNKKNSDEWRKCSTNRAFGRTERGLSYRFKIYLCTTIAIFSHLTALLICPSCCRFSHFLLFHLLFCLQQLIIPFFSSLGVYSLCVAAAVAVDFALCAFILTILWCILKRYGSKQISIWMNSTVEKVWILLFCIWKLLLVGFYSYRKKRSNLASM